MPPVWPARRVELREKLAIELGVALLFAGAVEDEVFLADQLAAAHEEDLHAGLAPRARRRDQIHVDARAPDDLLTFRHAPHGDEPVAQPRGRFVVEPVGRLRHLHIETLDQPVLLPSRKSTTSSIDEFVVLRFGLVADARREAAFDVDTASTDVCACRRSVRGTCAAERRRARG
jgi:hypothetical protein